MTATVSTLNLIKAIAALEFRPMDRNDFAAFADAEADGQIAFAGAEFAARVSDYFGDAVSAETDDSVAIVASGGLLQIFAIDPEGDPTAYQLDLTRL